MNMSSRKKYGAKRLPVQGCCRVWKLEMDLRCSSVDIAPRTRDGGRWKQEEDAPKKDQ